MNQNNNTNKLYKVSSMKEYMQDCFKKDVEDFACSAKIKSGFANLDAITSLYPGFYVLGAISSLGKTTFMLQMSDQIAKTGEKVMFFSYEQNRLELASKSISRLMWEKNKKTSITSLQIRKNEQETNEFVEEAIQQYIEYADNLYIKKCSFGTTIDEIEKCVNEFVAEKQQKPVVVVDYLQVISSDKNMKAKEVTDMNVRRLKDLQSQHNLILIVISSINRQNYQMPIDFESFKESGDIEYTADVVWGLQPCVMSKPEFEKSTNVSQKRKMLSDAKSENPRELELVCVKSRFGSSSYHCKFFYYSEFDYFEADMDSVPEELLEDSQDKDGFSYIQENLEIPF